jgi:transcriptional regulator with XRE-family HTH domain
MAIAKSMAPMPGRKPAISKHASPRAVHSSNGKRLRAARTAAGLSRQQLAKKVGVSAAAIYKWEGGHFSPGDANRAAIAKAVGRPQSALFTNGAALT